MPEFTTFDDLTLYYETHGFDADGPTLVFLNGMTQTTRHWRTHSRDLRGSRPILAYDARGQGQSDVPEEPPSLETHVRDLRALFDHLELEEVDLVGFSHGARIALGYASDVPERLRKMVLCSATAKSTALGRTIVRSWRHILDEGGVPALSWASLTHIVGNQFLENNEGIIDNIVRAANERNSERGVRLLLQGMEGFPELNELAEKVDAPTLVVSASGDPLVPREGAEKLAALCDGTHRHVENSGHTVPIETPDEFQEILGEFLGIDDRLR